MSREEDFEPLAWAAKGISRKEAQRWWDARFDLAEALRWRERFTVDESLSFRQAGVTTLREARGWRVAGVDAGEVAGWRDAGIGFAEAAAWNEFGYSLEEARERKAEGKSPSETYLGRIRKMRPKRGLAAKGQTSSFGWTSSYGGAPPGPHGAMEKFMRRVAHRNSNVVPGYFHRQWFDDEAAGWAERGIDAADALAWKELGISAPEAERLEKAGQTLAKTMRAWWEAGIPIDEVAAWLGAGLTPDEAAAQRGKGITAERAAILRALRETGDQSA